MADAEKLTIDLNIETNNIETNIENLQKGLNIVHKLMTDVNCKIETAIMKTSMALMTVNTSIEDNGERVERVINFLGAAVKEDLQNVIGELKNITSYIGQVLQKQSEIDISSTVANVSSAADSISNLWGKAQKALNTGDSSANKKNIETNNTKTAEVKNTKLSTANDMPLGLPAAGESSYGKNAENGRDPFASGFVSSGLTDFGSIFPDAASIGALAESIGNVANKLKESVVQWWLEAKAKAASRAEDLKNIATNMVEHVKSFGLMIAQLAASAAAWVAETAAKVASTAASWAQIAATTAWKVICVAATAVTTAFGAAMTFLTSPIGLVIVAITALIAIVVLLVQNWDTVKATVLNVWEAIKNALGAAWQWLKSTLLDPLVNGFKSVINGIIGFINGMIAGAVKGINGIINVLNKLQFSVPDWVPGLGGMTLGFDLKPVTAPQIPYLAQGAVLPANRPFLAVVGDQRHGTNVEALLATIQEAVAVVIDDYIGAMMAGFEALLAEQKATRQAVESIHIGDDVLYKAVQRRSRVMAIARGGL